MTQNKKKGIAKKALSISLVAAMLATSNVPVWASGFEAVDEQAGFALEESAPVAEEAANNGDMAVLGAIDGVWTVGDFADSHLADSIVWNNVTGLQAVLDAANALNPKAGYERLTARIGFLTGDIDSDGSLPLGSAFTPWDGTTNGAKANIGKVIAVELNSQSLSNDAKESYYIGGDAEIAPIDIETGVTAYEVSINGTKIKSDDSKKEVMLADDYEVDSVRLYFTDDKKLYQDFDLGTDGVTLTAEPATDNEVGANLAFGVICNADNTLGLTGTYENKSEITLIGKDLKGLVSFKSGSLTYDPTQTTESDAVKALVEVSKNLDARDYTIKAYKDNAGANPYDAANILPAGNIYLGVEGVDGTAYEGQKIINTARTNVAKKNLSTLVVDQSVFDEIAFDDFATDFANAKETGVKYNADADTAFDLTDQLATDELDVKSTPADPEVGEEVTLTITPKSGNTNYTGKLTIKFTPAVDKLPADVKSAFEDALTEAEFTYDAKTHTVNNLIKGDLDVLTRDQYTLTCVETGSTIKNAGEYKIKLTVTSGPYKGLTLTGDFTVEKADLSVFANGVGVSANKITYDPARVEKKDTMNTAAFIKELAAELGMVLTYNGVEVLRDGTDYMVSDIDWADLAAGDTIEVTIDKTQIPGLNNNFKADRPVTIKVGVIQKKAFSTLDLPEITAQEYGVDKNDIDTIKLTDGNGKSKGYSTFVKDGKFDLDKGTDYSYTMKLPADGLGTATLTLKGSGNYSGTVVKTFNIVNTEITADIGTLNSDKSFKNVIEDQHYDYDEMQKTDSKGIELTFGSEDSNGKKIIVRDIKTGADVTDKCEFIYTNNKAAGTATVEAKGKDGYTIFASATFKILPKQFEYNNTEDFVKLENYEFDYTGDPIEPKVAITIKDGKYTLKEGVDYVISYVNNTNACNRKGDKADLPALVIKGMGNYTFVDEDIYGDYEETDNYGVHYEFHINRVQINASNMTVKDVTYAGGLEVLPDVTIINPASGKALREGLDYTLSAINTGGIPGINYSNTNAGPGLALISLTPVGEANYEFDGNSDGTITIVYQINKKPLSECTASVADGKVVIKNGTLTVPESEYTVTENENGTFTVKAAEKNYTGTITVNAIAVEATTLRVTDRTTSTVSLAWDKVEGAQGYTIWFRSEHDSSVSRKIISGGDVTKWTQKGLAAGTKYFYTIKAWVKDAEGNYVFSEQSPVQRGTTKPYAARIKSVTAANGKIKVALSYNAAGAEMYSMCYSKGGSKFNENNFKVGIRTSYTTRTFTNAVSAGTYYVAVKSYRDLGNGAKVYGAWSNTMKVVVK